MSRHFPSRHPSRRRGERLLTCRSAHGAPPLTLQRPTHSRKTGRAPDPFPSLSRVRATHTPTQTLTETHVIRPTNQVSVSETGMGRAPGLLREWVEAVGERRGPHGGGRSAVSHHGDGGSGGGWESVDS
ncbi:hypothetical protein AAFF_G00157790 [Aldrovandia affinis]|uniref:Uncharacterized protein n=1 Tax=Aldrovandia affinis TaxID=143900 RepID=A0AAD7VX61_9TELE|nr:hypothetical protein AAFF_G00157790 [Aldrovandia affinis]